MSSECNEGGSIPIKEDCEGAAQSLMDWPRACWAGIEADLLASAMGSYECSVSVLRCFVWVRSTSVAIALVQVTA